MQSATPDPMTPKITDLTDEEINIKIAEFLGWKRIGPENPCAIWPMKEYVTGVHGAAMMSPRYSTVANHPPAFCTDLNAMHLAEKSAFKDEGAAKYFWALRGQFTDRENDNGGIDQFYIHATAKQRAQAFLIAAGGAVA